MALFDSLTGNNDLRQQFANDPAMQAWLDEREARILGRNAPNPFAMNSAPVGAPLMQAPQMPAQAPEINSAPQLPQASVSLPAAPLAAPEPQAPSLPPMLPPEPMLPPVMAPPAPAPPPMLSPSLPPGAIGQLPQQAPVISQVSPAPQTPAHANINNNVTMPQQTFAPAYQRPSLPSFLNMNLSPNMGPYHPPPSIPGYAMARTGSPFRSNREAPMGLPSFAPQLPQVNNGPGNAPLMMSGPFMNNSLFDYR